MGQKGQELPRDEWRQFFDTVTKDYEGADVTIEVVSGSYGDQFEAEKLPLADLEYDDKDDAVAIAVGGRDGRYPVVLRHVIKHPQRVLADRTLPGVPWVFDVEGADGTQTIIKLRLRPALLGD